MSSITQEQLNRFFEIIEASKLPSELTELNSITEDNLYAAINTGSTDAVKVKPSVWRGSKGNYDANTNTPSLTNGIGVELDTYRVSVAGSRDFGAGSISLNVGDILMYVDGVYNKTNSTPVGSVTLQNAYDGSNPPEIQVSDVSNGAFTLTDSETNNNRDDIFVVEDLAGLPSLSVSRTGVGFGNTAKQAVSRSNLGVYSIAEVDALFASLPAGLVPQGNWDANTNTPDITGTTETGYFWIVSVAGNTNLGGITDWEVNDWAVKTATGWAKVDNSEALVSWGSITGTLSDQTDLQDALDLKANLAGGNAFSGDQTFADDISVAGRILARNLGDETSQAAIQIVRTYDNTITSNRRGFRDDTIWNNFGNANPNLAYAVYDANPRMDGSFNHVTPFQSRPQLTNGTMTDLSGFVTGGNVVTNSNVANRNQFWARNISDDTGSTITNNYAFRVDDNMQGTNKWAFHSPDSNANALIEGVTTVGSLSTNTINARTSGTLTVNGTTTFNSGANNNPLIIESTDSIVDLTFTDSGSSGILRWGGGQFIFTSSVNTSNYFSVGANLPSEGSFRMENGGKLSTRNAANNTNIDLIYLDASDILQLGESGIDSNFGGGATFGDTVIFNDSISVGNDLEFTNSGTANIIAPDNQDLIFKLTTADNTKGFKFSVDGGVSNITEILPTGVSFNLNTNVANFNSTNGTPLRITNTGSGTGFRLADSGGNADLTFEGGVGFNLADNTIVSGNLQATGSTVNFNNLPTSAIGLSSGDIWNNLGVLNIVP